MSHLSDDQLSLLVDGELSLGAREAAGRHLRDCVGCAERLDVLVDVVAELRLAPALRWDAQATTRVLANLEQPRAREWSTTIAAAVAVIGAVALALELPALNALTGLLNAMVGAFSVLPSGLGLPAAPSAAMLLVMAVVGPLLAVRLARDRPHPRGRMHRTGEH